MLDESVGVMDAKRHLEQHLTRRDSPRPPTRVAHEHAHLLVARPTKALLFGTFSDGPADVRGPLGLLGEPRDLIKEPSRDARREEAHGETVPKDPSRVSHGFVPKPRPSNRLLLGVQAVAGAVTPAASRSALALSARSQVKSWSSRPKWPYAAVLA